MAPPREIGPFDLLEPLGAGGMGEVYKARDRRLNRFVALKFLADAASSSSHERFQREAQAIAALNHPNICTLHEVGDDHGRPYLVLELLEGETLRSRLRRTPLDAGQVLDFSLQIVDALDAAHRKGILHRDLKPENIWVLPSGNVKVLDFGLARLQALDAAEAPTVEQVLTSPGQAMGTVPYMSPEQARGEPLDARSDVFSFGSVFYEMASGHPPFLARSAAETTAAILKDHPPRLGQVRADLPAKFDEVAERCLEKEPDLRYQSAADLRGELKRLKRESGSVSTPVTAAMAPAAGSRTPRAWRWIALAVVALAAGVAAWLLLRPRPPAPVHLAFRQLTASGNVVDAVISPDGKFLAHIDAGPEGSSLHLLSIASGSDVQIVPPGKGCCQSPTFSPDESQVYYLANHTLQAVPLLGGEPRTIAAQACSGAAFSPDGSRIAYIASTGSSEFAQAVLVANADGSAARVLRSNPPGGGYTSDCFALGPLTHAPSWSPDGRWIALAWLNAGLQSHVELVNAANGQATDLATEIDGGTGDVSWLPGGRGLVFTAAIPSDAVPQVWQISYPDGQLTQLTNDLQGYTSASVSAQGQVALVHAAPQDSIWVQAAPKGAFRQLPGGGGDQDGTKGLAWTPTGGLVSLRVLNGQTQLWGEAADGSAARLLAAGDAFVSAYWLQTAPDGHVLITLGIKNMTVWRLNADGTGLTRLVQPDARGMVMVPVALQGGRIAYLNADGSDNQTLWTMPLSGGPARQLWTGYVYINGNPSSPDGDRIFAITKGPAPGSRVAIVLDAASSAVRIAPVTGFDYKTMHFPYGWTADGTAITYKASHGNVDNIWALPLNGGKPYALTHFDDLSIAQYAMSRDGRLAISRGSANRDAVVVTGLGH